MFDKATLTPQKHVKLLLKPFEQKHQQFITLRVKIR